MEFIIENLRTWKTPDLNALLGKSVKYLRKRYVILILQRYNSLVAQMVRPGRARAKEAVPSGKYTQQYFPGRLSFSPSELPRLFRWLWSRADVKGSVHMQGHKDRYTGKLTGAHTGTHVPKGTLAGRQDTSSHGNTCILTQAYGHPRDQSTHRLLHTRSIHLVTQTCTHRLKSSPIICMGPKAVRTGRK